MSQYDWLTNFLTVRIIWITEYSLGITLNNDCDKKNIYIPTKEKERYTLSTIFLIKVKTKL